MCDGEMKKDVNVVCDLELLYPDQPCEPLTSAFDKNVASFELIHAKLGERLFNFFDVIATIEWKTATIPRFHIRGSLKTIAW